MEGHKKSRLSIIHDKSGAAFIMRSNNSMITIRIDKGLTIKMLADDFFEIARTE